MSFLTILMLPKSPIWKIDKLAILHISHKIGGFGVFHTLFDHFNAPKIANLASWQFTHID